MPNVYDRNHYIRIRALFNFEKLNMIFLYDSTSLEEGVQFSLFKYSFSVVKAILNRVRGKEFVETQIVSNIR
jgi:hypothetical protein